jgi:hypothetical protein
VSVLISNKDFSIFNINIGDLIKYATKLTKYYLPNQTFNIGLLKSKVVDNGYWPHAWQQ